MKQVKASRLLRNVRTFALAQQGVVFGRLVLRSQILFVTFPLVIVSSSSISILCSRCTYQAFWFFDFLIRSIHCGCFSKLHACWIQFYVASGTFTPHFEIGQHLVLAAQFNNTVDSLNAVI